ncbi:DNA modification methylase [Microbacterium hydrocarbonoxydans]|uniref:DNA modification methylase n=1 Tax=Microbacterium hydrocarbonoxydans TaxID=273678 RepID=UPI00203FF17D|nr:DNA modification methylase [Microbacterium hydrocarbonoxydans]MCM3780051.1 DNA modification methylase [Microbacterium hydrocarbonoxydans]
MKSRLVASAAISALVLLGATGCTFITPQSTKIEYSASDGVNVSDSDGPLDVRNAFIVANEEGTVGNFVGAVVNPTSDKATLTITIAGIDPFTVTVPAGKTISFGSKDEDPLRIVGLDAKPGATVEVHFQSGDGAGTKTEVPVLDGTLPYYADLAPETASSTPSPTPTPSDTAAPAPEE